ncbi:DUF1499 domain-containing protein [Pseudoblastomonas halimionae]|uniref:DUF1499 domain-containing protein n=1 Tax=Alteriqipengyuania halimionae TaxID=1926630 RepID=A0A6I4TYM4_9SPHN|nr:DUF1499 domain-containing protein [Alteriqipengyuania halimionae]MXP08718.1 DUF1499 domain-containing protein [Alteriqipengyuania halimionae]
MAATTKHGWALLLGKIALTLALIAAAIAVVGTTLARYDVIDKLAGFTGFVLPLRPLFNLGELPVNTAMLIIVLALLALVLGWILARRTSKSALLAIVLAGALLGTGLWLRGEAAKYPAIHDATTDLANPPAFTALDIPADNLRGVETEAEWRKLHAEGYPDLETVTMPGTVAEMIARAEQLARTKGWTIIMSDAEGGHLEAVAYAGWLRFEDIVSLRVEVAGEDSVTVDMRSISRVGVSDLGYNAKRIRAFLGELAPTS